VSSPSHRLAIAGASSLLGKELKQVIEEDSFAAAHLRLLDEELFAGTLTEVGGEPAVVQRIEEDSFANADAVFLAGSPQFARQCHAAAQGTRAAILDLSGGLLHLPGARPWIPRLDQWLPAPPRAQASIYLCPSAPAIICCTLAVALSRLGAKRLVVNVFHPVSETGQAGIEELESQTAQLLSFQPLAQATFDAQVAFNLLEQYGKSCPGKLADARKRIAEETALELGAVIPLPAIQLLHAPVFYGTAVSAFAEFAQDPGEQNMVESLRQAGAVCGEPAAAPPSNVSVAGEARIHMARPRADGTFAGGWWFWGVADNLRLPADNALAVARILLS
jgi:aspartate-semialdehyde dehydrogenase